MSHKTAVRAAIKAGYVLMERPDGPAATVFGKTHYVTPTTTPEESAKQLEKDTKEAIKILAQRVVR